MFMEIYISMNNNEKVDPQEIFALSTKYYNTTNIVLWTLRIFYTFYYVSFFPTSALKSTVYSILWQINAMIFLRYYIVTKKKKKTAYEF